MGGGAFRSHQYCAGRDRDLVSGRAKLSYGGHITSRLPMTSGFDYCV